MSAPREVCKSYNGVFSKGEAVEYERLSISEESRETSLVVTRRGLLLKFLREI
jgi:hypothetical protein